MVELGAVSSTRFICNYLFKLLIASKYKIIKTNPLKTSLRNKTSKKT